MTSREGCAESSGSDYNAPTTACADVSAETACENLHKALPRKRHRQGDATEIRPTPGRRHESEPLWNQLMVRLLPREANRLSLSMRVSNAAVMHLNHLGLPVRVLRRSQQFYSAYFGFDPATAQAYEDGTVIIRNTDGFDLALHPVEQVEPSPAFLHVGFRAAEPADVRALMERMDADGITFVERNDEAAYVAFKCLDPDGHQIEVYWEPLRV
jgi:catechol 2,3-dioxygenase-like lactoylglutathione lyase family enzyme